MSQEVEMKREERYTIFDELVDNSPMFAKDFIKLYGFPNIIDKINRGLLNEKITAHVVINTPTLTTSYDVEAVGIKRNKVYVETKMSDWSDAENEVKLLRLNKRRAYLLTSSDKPHIRIYLDGFDEISFDKGDLYED
jgi:hypothetical protein